MAPPQEQNLSDLVAKYLNFLAYAKNSSLNTSKSYAIDLKQFLEPILPCEILLEQNLYILKPKKFAFIGLSELPNLTRKAQLRWSKLKASSRNRKSATLKSFLGWLYQESYLAEPLHTSLVIPKVPQKLPHFISMDEALALIRCLEKEGESKVLVLVYLLYAAGLRVSEACQLRWEDLDPGRGLILVRGKGGKQRQLALVEGAIRALMRLDKDEGPYVFGVRPLSSRKAYEWVRQSGVRAGLVKPLHPHALRHSFATHMLSSGADLRILQELLGHESLAATQKYLHISLDSLARTMESRHPLGEGGDL